MSQAAWPELALGSVSEFVDLDFGLASHTSRLLGGQSLEARAFHRGEEVGFAFDLARKWKVTTAPGGDGSLYWGHGLLRSLGPASDRLVRLLDEFYGTNLGAAVMNTSTKVGIVGLLDDPRLLSTRPTRMKLFFNADSDDEDLSAEVFLNTSVTEGVVQLHEKDQECRSALVRSLAGLS